jgi:NaMN:DMB phosphoribosyltransferase
VLDAKTKPLGALGRLERLAVRLAVAQRTLAPRAERAGWWCSPPTTASRRRG